MRIIISPSKEMNDQPQKSARRPALIEFAHMFSNDDVLSDDTNLYRAIDLYNGLQFRYLRTGLAEEDLAFLDDHLRILSATYGVVKPFDGIRHYRQDFTTKGLYKAWGDKIYQALAGENHPILNLASDEFSKPISRYAQDGDRMITVAFFEEDEAGMLKKHASISKKGRGQMVNYIARKRISDIGLVKAFDDMGYRFNDRHSDGCNWAFVRPRDSQ